jgi:hypothetical protein
VAKQTNVDTRQPQEPARTKAGTTGIVVMFVIAAAAIAAAYWWYGVRRINYFVARDLRGLSTLSAQTEAEVARLQDTMRIFAESDLPNPPENGRDDAKMFRDLDRMRREPAAPTAPKVFGSESQPAPVLTETVDLALVTTGVRPRLQIRYTTPDGKRASGIVDIEKIMRPLTAQPFLGIFDVILLVKPDGQVLYQAATSLPPPLPTLFSSGPDEPAYLPRAGLIVTDLSTVEEHTGWRQWEKLSMDDLGGASGRTNVRVMGAEYYLFTQPARFLTNEKETEDAPERSLEKPADQDKDNDNDKDNDGDKTKVRRKGADVLVCALVPKRKFQLQAMAISDSVLAIATGIAILLLCWYPYLRIGLLPRGAPLRPVDVVLAALAAVIGGAVLAIMIGDTAIFGRLSDLEDEQLARYGQKLRDDLQRDLLRSVRLTEAIRDWSTGKDGESISNLEKTIDWNREEIWQQPYFSGFVRVDGNGKTVANGATEGTAPPRIDQSRRQWFRDAAADRWWMVGERIGGRDRWHEAIVEISPGRGEPETTVAVPIHLGGGSAGEGAVAVSVPFIHFVDPVVPPGLAFAVLDENGTVLLHSEKQRALNENFFKETDDNRDLRGAIHARRDHQVNGRYWGVDHQMYVAPIPGTPWTAVAMREEAVLRNVNTESMALTALLLVLYSTFYACLFVLLAIVRPNYRAPWLWPDSTGTRIYGATVWALALECAAMLACVFLLAPPDVMAFGFIAPVRGLLTAYLMVNRRKRNRPWWSSLVTSALFTVGWGMLAASGTLDPLLTEQYTEASLRALLLVAVVVPFARSCHVNRSDSRHSSSARSSLLSVATEGIVAAAAVAIIAGVTAIRGGADAIALMANATCLTVLLYALTVGVIYVSGQIPLPRSKGRDLDEHTMTLYKTIGVMILILTAVLPAMAFLKTSMRVGVDARVKYAQLRLADALEKRLNRLERINVRGFGPPEAFSIRGLRVAFDCFSIPHALNSVWTLDSRSTVARPMTAQPPVPRPESERTIAARLDEKDIQSAWLPPLLQRLLPRYSENSIAIRDLHHDTSSDRSWQWWRTSRALTLRRTVALDRRTRERFYPEGDKALTQPPQLLIRSAIPQPMLFDRWFGRHDATGTDNLNCHEDVDSRVGTAIAGIGLPFDPPRRRRVLPLLAFMRNALILLGICFAVWLPWKAVEFLGKRVFLFDPSNQPWMPTGARLRSGAGTHLFVERGSRKVEELADLSTFAKIELSDVLEWQMTWRDLLCKVDAVPATQDILIADFEKAFASPEFPYGVLSFFEEIHAAGRHTMVVFSDVSAATILAAQTGETRERWQRLIDAFVRIDAAALQSGYSLPATCDDSSRRTFERIWTDSSPKERLMLYQIARDGLANGKNKDVLRRLFARGLVRREPELVLASDGFEQFVLVAGKRDAVTDSERDATPPRWQSLRYAALMLVAAGIIVMLTTQNELISTTSAIVTALAAGIPAALRLITVVQGRQSADTT